MATRVQRKKPPERKWIGGAIKRPGSLRRQLGVKEGETIPASKLEPKPSDSTKTKRRKNLAKTLRKINRRKR